MRVRRSGGIYAFSRRPGVSRWPLRCAAARLGAMLTVQLDIAAHDGLPTTPLSFRVRWHLVGSMEAPPSDSLLESLDPKISAMIVRSVSVRAIDQPSAGPPASYGGRLIGRSWDVPIGDGVSTQRGSTREAQGTFDPMPDEHSLLTCGLQIDVRLAARLTALTSQYRLEVRISSKLLKMPLICYVPFVMP